MIEALGRRKSEGKTNTIVLLNFNVYNFKDYLQKPSFPACYAGY